MKVTLKLLAIYRKYLPPEAEKGAIEVEITPGTQAVDLVSQFGVPIDDTSVILVNGRTPDPDVALQDGDVVFVFPAMAGG